MKSQSSLWVVIPVHNRKDFTLACLESLAMQSFVDFAVVVVDDGSADGTAETVLDRFPLVHLIRGTGDLWWSGATNRGFEYALDRGATMLLMLNDDLKCDPEYIAALVDASNLHPDCLLGSTAYDLDSGEITYSGEFITWMSARFNAPGIPRGEDVVEVSHLPGRGTLVPATVVRKVGLIDERYLPQYGADYDFSMRARSTGFGTYCVRKAKIYSRSLESGSTKLVNTRSIGNYFRHLFGKKGGGNLAVFCRIAWRHCPRRYLFFCLVSGIAARIGGYLKEWFKEVVL